MRIALCNEVIRDKPFEAQCVFAAALGYDALEVAPFTLGDRPDELDRATRQKLRRAAADAGIAIASLHWLLVAPAGLSITSADAAVRERTLETMRRLIDLCADLGGAVLVHGSPAQRHVSGDDDRAHGVDAFASVAAAAEAAGVTYCIEPLAREETEFVNTVAEAADIVRQIGSPAVKTMIDCCAAGHEEALSLPDLIDRWMPSGLIAHIQVNDTNRRGPGQGEDLFAPVFAALRRNGYTGTVAVEPFDYQPDGAASAARAIGYIRGILEAQSTP